MKRRIFSVLFIVIAAAVCSSLVTPIAAENNVSVSSAYSQPELKMVMSARFLNMLNHNYVYNEDFDSALDIADLSVAALLDMRDKNDPDFIAEQHVNDFIFNMYGINGTDITQTPDGFPKKEGFVYIIPRGYSEYHHRSPEITANEDGTYTVVTDVTITTHENDTLRSTATTLFVPNSKSCFGFNIVYSNIEAF